MEVQTEVMDVAKRTPSSDTVQLNVRVPEVLELRVDATARAEALEAELRGDESGHINVSFVVRQALRRYVENYWDKHGGLPKDLDENSEPWKAFVETLKKHSKR